MNANWKLSKRLLLQLILLCCSIYVSAYDFEVDGICYNILSDSNNEVEVTSKKNQYGTNLYSGDISIPSEVVFGGNKYTVTIIGGIAFYGCGHNIKSVTLPNTIKTIGDYSFKSLWDIKSIDLPPSLINIGVEAFCDCQSLESIDIPENVTSIGANVFNQCKNLKSVTVGKSLKDIGNGAFSYCSLLGEINISNVETLGRGAFAECTNLRTIILPQNLSEIGERTFSECKSLKSIIIPKSVKSIGNFAFENCSALDTIISKIEEPFEIPEYVFLSSAYNGQTIKHSVLLVPYGSKSKYQQYVGWYKYFTKIEEEIPNYSFTIISSGNGSVSYEGNNIRNDNHAFTIKAGESVSIMITPDDGYRIKSVKVNNADVTSSVSDNSYTINSISANTTLEVEFEAIPAPTYTLSITAIGSGSASYNGTTIRGKTSLFTVNEGTSVSISITPDNGYRIKNVKENNTNVTSYVSNGTYTINSISRNTNVEVEFEAETTIQSNVEQTLSFDFHCYADDKEDSNTDCWSVDIIKEDLTSIYFNMSEESFSEKYVFDAGSDNIGYQFRKDGDSFTRITTASDLIGVVREFLPGTYNNETFYSADIRWTLGASDLQKIYRDLNARGKLDRSGSDIVNTEPISTWVRYKQRNAADNAPAIYLQFVIPARYIHFAKGRISGGKILSSWYQLNSSSLAEGYYNAKEVHVSVPVSTSDIRTVFLGGYNCVDMPSNPERLSIQYDDLLERTEFLTNLHDYFTNGELYANVDNYSHFPQLSNMEIIPAFEFILPSATIGNASFSANDQGQWKVKGISGAEYTLALANDNKEIRIVKKGYASLSPNPVLACINKDYDNDIQSVIKLHQGQFQDDILNYRGHDDLGELETFTAYLRIFAPRANVPLEFDDAWFNARFLRPVNLENPNGFRKENDSNWQYVDLAQAANVTDWRGYQGKINGSNQNGTFDLAYYQIEFDADEANTLTDANLAASVRQPVSGNLGDNLNDVLDINTTTDANYSVQRLSKSYQVQGLNIEKVLDYNGTPCPDNMKSSLIRFKNNSNLTDDFRLFVPVNMTYVFGQDIENAQQKYITVELKQPAQQVSYTLSIQATGNGSAFYDGTTIRGNMSSFTVNEGMSATIYFSPDNGYRIKSVKENNTNVTSYVSNNTYTISSINRDTNIEVEFEAIPITTYTLSIKAIGNGSALYNGTTIREKTSSFTVNEGAKVSVSLTPDNGYRIKSVKENDTNVTSYVSNGTYTINIISRNTNIEVEFEAIPPTTYTLSIKATGNGSATYNETTIRGKTSIFTVNEGVSATITFSPDNGYRIKSVKVNNTDITSSVSNNQYIISYIASDTSVEVEFEDGGAGTGADGSTIVSIADFIAAPESTDVWYQLTGKVKNLKDNDQYGNFDLEDSTGSVYVYGLLSEKGGVKKKFQELAAEKGIANDKTITIVGNRGSYNGKNEVLNAYFISIAMPSNTYTLSIVASGNGSATYNDTDVRNGSKVFTVNEGATATITFSPDNGHRIKSVKLNNTNVTSGVSNNLYTISNISDDTTLEVEFEMIPVTTYTLSIKASGNGTASYNGKTIRGKTSTFTINDGASATISFSPDNGYRITSVKVNDTDVTANVTDNAYIISSISVNITLEVEFGEIEYASEFTVDGVSYKVLSQSDKTVNVDAGKYGQVLTIPERVTSEGATWTVVGIEANALSGNKELAAVIWNPDATFNATVSNPNLLLYVKAEQYAPSSIQNVVVNGNAKRIVLAEAQSGNNFYCPQAFTAQQISYTHNYQMQTGIGESKGWETIALPFDVQTFTHETKGTIVPFAQWKSGDAEKPFWLYELTGSGFVETGSIKAYTPYIISMPNNPQYDSQWLLNGKVTFAASGVTVGKTENLNQSTFQDRTFIPCFAEKESASGVYALNVNNDFETNNSGMTEGSKFVLNMRHIHPFEAYMTNPSSAPEYAFGVFEGMTTSIENFEHSTLNIEHYYDLQGRRIGMPTKKGVYIINGKKKIIK